MNNYLGYWFITPEMGLEGYGGYRDFAVVSGNTPEEVVIDYFKKTDPEYKVDANKINIKNDTFYYHDYFNVHFVSLPRTDIDIYLPNSILGLVYANTYESEGYKGANMDIQISK